MGAYAIWIAAEERGHAQTIEHIAGRHFRIDMVISLAGLAGPASAQVTTITVTTSPASPITYGTPVTCKQA